MHLHSSVSLGAWGHAEHLGEQDKTSLWHDYGNNVLVQAQYAK